MSPHDLPTCTAFDGHALIASGPLADVALAVKRLLDRHPARTPTILDDGTGQPVEIDFRGSADEVLGRLQPPADSDAPRGAGRPRLGVVAREVTLLPRHWYWLNSQPGGASVTLRKLVEDARRNGSAKDRARLAGEAADRFMSVVAGDLAGYEEASRALWRGDRDAFNRHTRGWPKDVREHARRLAAIARDAQADAG
ncbi:DUF2239 family protein [Rhodanobacter sp. PCA2]|uniref:DUF2239 family protein n=1 Tax=Rhodanobacter sp. PCA2 TaxID=2006117 RepID=UPI0015E757FE|nr:DUF2239 family protein [Rhodanobacter sp. PCA2]MBA2077076.1 hypothetical protein [Rhodanobacter sp. PCA2]